MNLKTWIPLALAIVLGFVAMKIARDVLSKRTTGGVQTANLTDVVVVKRNISAGAALKADDLAIGKMGTDIPPESVFRNPQDLEGRVIRQPLYTGQPVLDSLLLPRGAGSGLQALVPKGMRAITLEINEFSGVAGFLIPGCRVDVVSTINGEGGETLSRTVVQNVEVTAVGRQQSSSDNQADQVKSVTLLVNPRQAEALELAASTGRPRLVLRGSGDDSDASSFGITVAELRGRARKNDPWTLPAELFTPRPANPPQPATKPANVSPVIEYIPNPQRTIRIIKAGTESQVTIELPRTEKGSKWMTDAD